MAPTKADKEALSSYVLDALRETRFEDARDAIVRFGEAGGVLDPTLVFQLSQAERALVEYDRAEDVLYLAGSSDLSRSAALAHVADIAWIKHDYEAGHRSAVHALQLALDNRRAELTRDRCADPYTKASDIEGVSPENAFAHAAFYVSARGNFGDLVLPPSVRGIIETIRKPESWLSVHVHQVFDQERVDLVNRTAGLFLGGGGLFLPDTAPNRNSGWQWNITEEMLGKIDVPLGVVGVGYNLFPGQSFRGDLFERSVSALVERADLVGLRNHGSVARVRDVLPSHLADKVSFLPCPTTVLNHTAYDGQPQTQPGSGRVLINAAYDRADRRFGAGYQDFLDQMAHYITTLRDQGIDVALAAHLPADERLGKDLRKSHGIALHIEGLYDLPLREAYDLYRQASVVVGMRGHATMIPFGLGTPVLSIISHPKMRYFLEDIDRTEWGFDVEADDLGASMAERTLAMLSAESEVRADIASIQLELLEIMQSQLRAFPGLVPSK